MEHGDYYGMRTFDGELYKLYKEKKITMERGQWTRQQIPKTFPET